MSSLSHAASSAEKRTNASLLDSGDARLSSHPSTTATAPHCPLPAQNGQRYRPLIRRYGLCFSAFHGPMLSGRSWRLLAAGPLWFQTRLFLVYFHLSSSLLQGFVDIFSGFGIIVAPLYASSFPRWSGGIASSRATVALLQPAPGAGEGNGSV